MSGDRCEWCPDRIGPKAGGGELWHKDADGKKVSDGVDPGWSYCAKKWVDEHPEVAQGTPESHPGTNCCADFRCCASAIAKGPLAATFAALAEGEAVIPVNDPSETISE